MASYDCYDIRSILHSHLWNPDDSFMPTLFLASSYSYIFHNAYIWWLMITEYTEFNIICDDCEITGNHNFLEWCHKRDLGNTSLMGTELFSTKGIRDLRKKAKRFGWILKKSSQDLCPRCSDKPEHKRLY